jgi:signal transduction histidine kinase
MPTISLKATVRAVTIGAAFGCVLILAAMAGAYSVLELARSHVKFADALNINVAKLNLLTTELFVNRSQRAHRQWSKQHNMLIRQLAAVQRLQDRADHLTIEIEQRLRSIGMILDRLNAPPTSRTSEARHPLLASMIAESEAVLSRAVALRETMTSAEARTRDYVLLALGGAFLTVMIGGGLALLLLSRGVLSHILSLRATIRRISHGDLEAEIPECGRNEMGDVFAELGRMRLNLLDSMSELGRANLELISIKAKLEDRTAGLETANRELDAFASAVSHDLRAPLRTISGFSQAVLEDYGAQIDEDGKAMLERIHRATRQMYQLIEDLLKLSKLGRRSLIPADTDLSALVSEICGAMQEQNPEHRVHLIIEAGVKASCDQRLMRIALTNLIANGWKFTSRTEGAEIEFGEIAGKARRTFFIRDNGVGFDMAFSGNLFKPFKRLHSASEFPGTGIGLATVERIIGLHGGKVWARSYPDEGATFFFFLGQAGARSDEESRITRLSAEPPAESAEAVSYAPLRAVKKG